MTALRQPETLLAFERRARDRGFELSDVTARARPVDGSAFRRLDVDRGRMRVHVLEASQRTSNARARGTTGLCLWRGGALVLSRIENEDEA